MNLNLTQYHQFSTLSQAAYANYTSLDDDELVADALVDVQTGGFTQEQADFFTNPITGSAATGYNVLYFEPTDGVDFSASLFQSRKDTSEYTLAVRGFDNIAADTVRNSTVATLGVAVDQLVCLVNLYQRLATETGEQAVQLEVVRETTFTPPASVESVVIAEGTNDAPPTYLYLRQTDSAAGLGEIPAGAQINVVGHSLGGHLAAAFCRLFESDIAAVCTFNSPGFDSALGSQQADEILGLFEPHVPAVSPVFNATLITSLVGEEGSELVSAIGTPPSPQQLIFIEPRGLESHRIAPLSDALAVQSLFGLIDGSVALDDLDGILQATSNVDAISLDQSLFSIARLFEVEITGNPASWTRDEYYQNLYGVRDAIIAELPENAASLGLTVISLVDTAAVNIAAQAQTDIAYRYALQELNPFVVTGDPSRYTAHNQLGELDPDQFSNQYLLDRATMLALTTERGVDDISSVEPTASGHYYQDLASGASIGVRPDGTAAGIAHIFGSIDDDAVVGTEGTDHLYGVYGDDSLSGAAGDDYLEGGQGADRLYDKAA